MNVEVIRTLACATEVRTERPVNYDPADEGVFPEWGDYTTNDQDIFRISDAVVTDKGVVFNRLRAFDKHFVHPSLIRKFNALYLLKVILTYRRIKIHDVESYVLAFDPWSARNYYHWIIDALPRLYLVRDEIPGSVLLLPRNASGYMRETAQLFKPKEILELSRHTYMCSQNLYLSRPIADSGKHDGSVLLGVRDFILSRVEMRDDGGAFGERIYVSRARQAARKVRNETEVQDLLSGFGFTVVYFENMSFVEQVDLMRRARYVVSSHGANLTNILFMPEGSKVLEINKAESPNLCYWSLATSIRLDYFYQFCPIAQAGADKDNNADLIVDIGILRKNVETMLGS